MKTPPVGARGWCANADEQAPGSASLPACHHPAATTSPPARSRRARRTRTSLLLSPLHLLLLLLLLLRARIPHAPSVVARLPPLTLAVPARPTMPPGAHTLMRGAIAMLISSWNSSLQA